MESNKVDLFMATMNDKFPNAYMMSMRSQLEKLPDDKFIMLQSMNYHNPIIILVISVVLGTLGIDRFMLGQTGLGVLKLLTCGGMGIWTLIDWFLVMDVAKEQNFQKFMMYAR